MFDLYVGSQVETVDKDNLSLTVEKLSFTHYAGSEAGREFVFGYITKSRKLQHCLPLICIHFNCFDVTGFLQRMHLSFLATINKLPERKLIFSIIFTRYWETLFYFRLQCFFSLQFLCIQLEKAIQNKKLIQCIQDLQHLLITQVRHLFL